MHRKLDLDFLKAVAAFAVILLHTSSTCMVHVPKGSPEWMALNAWNSMTHWAVGMFVMISGVLLLDSERNLSNRKLFSYVGHILRCYFGWSFLYTILVVTTNGTPDTIVTFLAEWLQGHYHMWYLWMILGIYLVLPILRIIARDRSTERWFVVLAVVFGFLRPSFQELAQLVTISGKPVSDFTLLQTLNNVTGTMNVTSVVGYSCIFVIGHYVYHTEFQRRTLHVIYLLGVLGAAFSVGLAFWLQALGKEPITLVGDYMWNVLAMNIALLLFCRQHLKDRDRQTDRWIHQLSECGLGCYLLHAAVLEILDHPLGFRALSMNPAIGVPAVALVVYVISMSVIWIMRKTAIGRYFC